MPYSGAGGLPAPYSPYAAGPVGVPQSGPGGAVLVSAGGRIGAVLLDALLIMVTLWIGWLVWAMFTWADGQSPGKKLLGHVVVDARTGVPFDWGRMALREFCVKGLLAWVLNLFTFGFYALVDAFMVFSDGQRTLHDRMSGSVVRYL
ncbi:putative RDD family membrane protein YckC [Actinoplanes octamycinicus]|uniref:Putative RDD family membrane protein YckC n=1 Tax=Actinoplanes octamycinicus TaxID=135948 RepID=A0A7W7M8Y3_9ACTN|nr:RDD family protein [Actinoplanes octamycinicus]MBB4741300.1 putative RDD family membrane protein YckC [Actinoplanes octamycinicus]